MSDNWIKEFKKKCYLNKIQQSYIDECVQYAEKLLKHKVPVIFNLEHLALLTGTKERYLSGMIFAREKYYRSYEIPKRKGGKRRIDAPQPSLKAVQRWIYEEILRKVKTHFAVYSFKRGKSLLDNIKYHIASNAVLKIDIKDFFPSIDEKKVFYIFYSLGYTKKVSFLLTRLCTLNGCLPQGAPTSPVISNIVGYKMDWDLYHLSKTFGLYYSRYADDMCFSGNIDKVGKEEILNKIKKKIFEHGFKINPKKTTYMMKHQRQIITGIVINNKESVPREYEKKIRQELYYIEKYGLNDHINHIGENRNNYFEHLSGKINFLYQVSQRKRYLNYKTTLDKMKIREILI